MESIPKSLPPSDFEERGQCPFTERSTLMYGEANERYFRCESGQCIPLSDLCDGVANCGNDVHRGQASFGAQECPRPSWAHPDEPPPCSSDEWYCNGAGVYERSLQDRDPDTHPMPAFVYRRPATIDCPVEADGSVNRRLMKQNKESSKGRFPCLAKQQTEDGLRTMCARDNAVCNGVENCADGSDELNCFTKTLELDQCEMDRTEIEHGRTGEEG